MTNKVVTILSDFWFYDSMINTIRYKLENKNWKVYDLGQHVQRNNLIQATYVLSSVFKHYIPEHTYHICLVGVYDCDNNDLVYAQIRNMKFIAPNNGLLSMLCEQNANLFLGSVRLCTPFQNHEGIANAYTFIDKAIDIIENDNDYFLDTQIKSPNVVKITKRPTYNYHNAQEFFCDIIQVNYFNNIVLNITKNEFDMFCREQKFNYITFEYNGIDFCAKFVSSPNQVHLEEDYEFAIFNDEEYLEIGTFRGDFAYALGIVGYSNCDYKMRQNMLNHFHKDVGRILFKLKKSKDEE